MRHFSSCRVTIWRRHGSRPRLAFGKQALRSEDAPSWGEATHPNLQRESSKRMAQTIDVMLAGWTPKALLANHLLQGNWMIGDTFRRMHPGGCRPAMMVLLVRSSPSPLKVWVGGLILLRKWAWSSWWNRGSPRYPPGLKTAWRLRAMPSTLWLGRTQSGPSAGPIKHGTA